MSDSSSTLRPLIPREHRGFLNVIVFGSGTGSNLQAILDAQGAYSQRDELPPFRVRAVFCDRICPCQDLARRYRIPLITHSYHSFKEAQEQFKSPKELRSAYDSLTVSLLLQLAQEEQFEIDCIFLAGYKLLVRHPLLDAFKGRIFNVHPGDLSVKDSEGNRVFIGLDAVQKALESGQKTTRSCVFVVNAGVDEGEVLVSGPRVSYPGPFPLNKESIREHQERQKRESDWPAVIQTLELLASGRITTDSENSLYIDGEKLGPSGLEMEGV